VNELPVVIIVGAGTFQLPAIIEAKKNGFFVVVLDGDPNAPGFAYADKSYTEDIKDPATCLEAVKDEKPVAVFALATEVAVITVATLAKAFGLKGVSMEAALNCTNKRRMRECFLKDNLPSPKFFAISDKQNLHSTAQSIGYPLVIKPSDNAGSRGVSIVESTSELDNAYEHAMSFSRNNEILIEEYMRGEEISVEAFVQDGEVTILSLSDKIRTPPPYPLDIRVVFPSNKIEPIQEEAKQIAEQAIKSCELDNAVVHIEMMVTADGPKLVEMAARGAGFHVFSKMLAWVCGINTIELLMHISLGRKVFIEHLEQRGAVLSFPFAKTGVVKQINGLDAIRLLKGVRDTEVYVKPGDTVNMLRSGSDRVGHIITYANDRATAIRIADDAEKLLTIEVV